MSGKYYVYLLIDPRTNEPFYVGKGSGKRVSAHVREAVRGVIGANPDKTNRIKEILEAGLNVREEIRSRNLSESAAYDLERELIDSTPGLGAHRE